MITTEAPEAITLTPYMGEPITVYYCKAKLATGNPVRVYRGRGRQRECWDCTGIEMSNCAATMDLNNSTTLAKASGARCVLIITSGDLILKNPTERTA
ncbi:MAG: hypothetical protein P8J87_14370 [Verrucomicrobiales bacterium]|nr:hypothetical protein [Verrucomicrobiales bacterium]